MNGHRRMLLHIFGKVQGVSYRYSASQQAEKLGLVGFVMNREDGSVYAEAEGPMDALADFVEWCEDGPELAKVTELKCIEEPALGYAKFEIRY